MGFCISHELIGVNIMKSKKVNELFKRTALKVGGVLLATAIVFGAGMYGLDSGSNVPELVTYVDSDGSIEITEDETPLAAPKVTTSTKVSKKTKKIKLKKAAKKTYSKKGKSTTKKQTAKSKSGNTTTTTETVVATSVLNKYKKGSKTQTRVTTTKTTITKTVMTASSASGSTTSATATASKAPAAAATTGNVSLSSIASAVDSRVSSAFNTLGFKVTVNPSVSYSGLFDARTRTITLKKVDSTIYHELGHFVAFLAGNMDTSSAFQEVFNQEKSKYTAYNKSYVLANSSEYFAESFRNYTENPAALQAERPQTYAAMQTALSKITSSQVSQIASVYSAIWK